MEHNFLRDLILARRYALEERAHLDYLANMEYQRNEGRNEERNAAARGLRTQGILTDEQIAQALNMPVETVAAL